MASHAVELPADNVLVPRGTRADRSLRRRVFLASLLAVCAVLSVALTAVYFAVRAEIKTGVLDSLRITQHSLEQARSVRNVRASAVLAWVSRNPALAANMVRAGQSRLAAASRARALRALESFARSARDTLQAEAAAVQAANGRWLVAVPRQGPAALLFASATGVSGAGVWDLNGTLYSVSAVPVRWRRHPAGTLLVATRFDLAGLDGLGPWALLHRGQVIRTTLPPSMAAQIGALPPGCFRQGCVFTLHGEDFLATPVSRAAAGDVLGANDQLVTLRSIDAAAGQFLGGFGTRLPVLGLAAFLLAVCLALPVSQAVARPILQLVDRLERSRAAGRWVADFPEDSPMREVNQLAAAINRAALEVAHSNERLNQAYIDFVETMAQALDARDPNTAGHSERVSDYATAIATALHLPPGEIETIRVGARLHDIGKIGISDTVLQKAGNLTPEEYETVKLHPQIGRKILERGAAFEQYLQLVELHHEDFDGHGYPYGLKGHGIPLGVRVIRVADVFDALTTDRSYRRAMPLDRAFELIASRAGVQFDPDVVDALRATLGILISSHAAPLESLARLTLS